MTKHELEPEILEAIDIIDNFYPDGAFSFNADNENYWKNHAECKQSDPKLFFAELGENGRYEEPAENVEKAKIICGRCVVKEYCLLDSISTDDAYNFRAGLTEKQRRRLTKVIANQDDAEV